MARIEWGSPGKRFYEAGLDRGVLYVGSLPGVPWNGLTTVDVSSTGGEAKPFYLDGIKYLNVPSPEEFQATITAYTYPEEFGTCDGSARVRPGLYVTHQRRKPFGFTYRTMIGNDLSTEHGYKIHIVYNALAAPSGRNHQTLGENTTPGDFSWAITTRPVVMDGYYPTPHIIIDSRTTNEATMAIVEDILYGTSEHDARLPDFEELFEIYDDNTTTFEVIDNGNGTFTVIGPPDAVHMTDDELFEITWPTAIFIDDDTYTVSS
jgi:hypothetical protein